MQTLQTFCMKKKCLRMWTIFSGWRRWVSVQNPAWRDIRRPHAVLWRSLNADTCKAHLTLWFAFPWNDHVSNSISYWFSISCWMLYFSFVWHPIGFLTTTAKNESQQFKLSYLDITKHSKFLSDGVVTMIIL